MKKFLIFLLLLPIWGLAQTNFTPQFKRNIPIDSLLGYSIPGATGNHWLPDTAWVKKHGANYTATNGIIKTGNNFTLGGALTLPVTITTDPTNNLTIGGADMVVNGNTVGKGGGNVTGNVVFGPSVLPSYSSSAPGEIVAIGDHALSTAINTFSSVAVGPYALSGGDYVAHTTAVGEYAGSGSYPNNVANNTFIGAFSALTANGGDNTLVGYSTNSGGLGNTVLGSRLSASGNGKLILGAVNNSFQGKVLIDGDANAKTVNIDGKLSVNSSPTGTAGTDSLVVKHGNTFYAISPAYYGTGSPTPDWSSITGKPTTLSGYGITDGITAATAASTYAPIASPTFTGTVTLPIAFGALKLSTTAKGVLMTEDGAGTVFLNNTSPTSGVGNVVLDASPSISTPYVVEPTIGGGFYYMNGITSGAITFNVQATTGSYNFNFPTSLGASGTLLTAAGAGSTQPMTWTDIHNYAFTTPTATTPTTSDNSTLIATTAYVQANFAATTIYFASGLFTGAGTSGSPYDIGNGHITAAMLSATGTPSSSTYLRGDGIWSTPSSGFTNPMTTLGDMMYENSTPAAARLAGNTTTTQKFLTQTGTGSVSAAPAWVDLFGGNNTFSGTNTYNGVTTVATTNTASSGASNVNYGLFVNNTVNQTGTAGFSDIYVNRINTAPGSGGQNLLRLDVGGSSVFTINTTGGVTGSSSITMNGAFTTNQFSTSSTASIDGIYMFNNASASSTNHDLVSMRTRWMAPVWNTGTTAQNFAFMYNELRSFQGNGPTYSLYWDANLSTTSTMGSGTDIASLTNSGDYKTIRSIGSGEITFANKPASPYIGQVCNFSDSTVNTFGATIAGGGTNHVSGRWNGTNWTVTGV